MTPLVVMVAPNGARRTKADHPRLPMTAEELAEEAAACVAAGATLIHLHVRDAAGAHVLDADLYRAATDAVRRRVGDRMVVQVTTEAVGRYGPDQQMAMVRALHPEAVSMALGELIPDDAATDEAAELLTWLRSERIAPQFILYTPAEVIRFHELRRRGVIPQARPFVLFVLGGYTEPAEVRPRDVLPYLKAHDADFPWAVCAFGRAETACVLTAAGLGGHVRVGFENNLWLPDGSRAESNADLVTRVVAGAKLVGRPIADVATTRALLAETAV